ncbi:MAG TPA: riboflavin biosynthesis protein RibF [Candidatus Limnocylindria bacterium]|nr:riboflavin biosynthesis protein RibF [Candidatus Limnocylindria bacterium]
MTLGAVQPIALDALPSIGAAVLTMGVFDGVHRGHRHLLDATRDAARSRGVPAVALVFDPPPIEVLRRGTRVRRLAPLDVNVARIEAEGMDHVVLLRFDAGIRQLPAEAFLDALAPAIELRGLVMTPESAFGRDREGTPDALEVLGRQRGFDVLRTAPLEVDGAVVSSTRVRQAIDAGDVRGATALLGAPPLLRGTVVSGDRRGRELGFPTANLAFDYLPALPPLGIYVGRVVVPERGVGPGHPALVSIGVRPTFHHSGTVLVEVYLLDFDGDLYDAQLTVELLERLRPEQRFDSVDALVGQMRDDERQARAILGI